MNKVAITGFIITIIFFGDLLYSQSFENLTKTVKEITPDEKYYPMAKGSLLFFEAYKKAEPDKIIKVKAEIKDIEKKDEKDYFYFYAPKVDIRYLIRRDKNGVYMRVIRYPFPIFNFSIEANIIPEVNFFKFPLKAGNKWEQKAKASAQILFFSIERNITGKFEVVKREKIKTKVGEIDTYLIHAVVDQGDGKATVEKYWYGKGFGYVRADTNVHFAELVGYSIIDEETGQRYEKLPEKVNEYE
ncbi:MAG: hypothetical protein N2114_00300 [Candidatus Goldbacteria bacterium]|nr:hypothetical protein [Candidatus Goldiibacteriota bacterium]